MKIARLALAVAASACLVVGIVACSSPQLRQQADFHQSVGETAESAAVRVEQALASGASLRAIADSPDFTMIRLTFPQVDQAIDEANAKGDDLRPVFEQLVLDLRATSGANLEQAQVLRAKADDANLTEWDRFGAGVSSAVTAINPIIGMVVGGLVTGVAAWRRGQASGAAQVASVINTGRAADDSFDAHFNGASGKVMAAELSMASKPVQKAVADTKISTGGAA